MRKRSVIGHIFLIQIIFFLKSDDRAEFELFGRKTPELKDSLTMLVMVGRSAGRQCFRRRCSMTEIEA